MLEHYSATLPARLQTTRMWAKVNINIDWGVVVTFGFPLFLYIFTLAPTIYNLDSAELTAAAATGGIMRATGYPLYLSLGWLWTWLPFGDVAYRLNLMSAFMGALTIVLAELSLRQLKVDKWMRWGALGLLVVSPFFWAFSIIAEVYTLHTALMGGVILSLLKWRGKPTATGLWMPAFLLTLSLGNHMATTLLAPAAMWIVLTTAPRLLLRPRTWLALLSGMLLGATIFLYLPIRYAADPLFNYAGTFDASGTFHPINLQTWEGFFWLLSGQTFAGQMFGYNLAEFWMELKAYTQQLWEAFFIVGVGPGLLGLVVLWRRDWKNAGMFTLIFLANAIFYINYRVIDKNTMFLPTYLVWAIWVAIGYLTIFGWLTTAIKHQHATINNQRLAALRLLFILPILLSLFWNYQRVNLGQDWSVRQQSEFILQHAEPNAIILGWWDTVPAIQYLQLVEGQRPDILAINRFLITGEDMTLLIEKEVRLGRPIYISNPPIQYSQTMLLTQVGTVYRLQPKPTPP